MKKMAFNLIQMKRILIALLVLVSYSTIAQNEAKELLDEVSVKVVGISSTGFATAQNEPTIPQIPLVKSNEKMLFDGSDGYVQLPVPFSYTIHSISAWFIADAGDKYIFASQDSGTDGIALAINANRTIWYALRGSGSGSLSTTTAINFNELNHIVATYDGSTAKVYINGVLGGSASISDTISTTTNARIGALSYSGIAKHSGTIHDVSFWNTALTETQAQELFNDGVALDATTHSKKGNLLGYWRNDGVTTWQDRRGWSYLDFDGTGDYVNLGTNNTFYGNKDLTLSCWIKTTNTSGSGYFIARDDASGVGRSFYMGMHSSSQQVIFRVAEDNPDNNVYRLTSTSIDDGNWHHCVGVFVAGTSILVYVDGTATSSTFSLSGTFPTNIDTGLELKLTLPVVLGVVVFLQEI